MTKFQSEAEKAFWRVGLHFHYGIKKCHMPAWRILHRLCVSFLKVEDEMAGDEEEMVDLALGST